MLRLAENIIICCSLFIGIRGQQMLGAGEWMVLSTQPCACDEKMPWAMRLRRHKINRTHDGFDCDIQVLEDVDDTFAVRVDTCKMVDGGCKPYMVIADDCLPSFVKKYAGENVKLILEGAGMDPPDFPVRKGPLHVKDYMINREDLVKEGLYGTYEAEIFIMKDGEELACAKLVVKYEPTDDYSSKGGFP